MTGIGSLFYFIQLQENEKGKWRQEIATKELEVKIIAPSSGDHVRVCAANNVDYKKSHALKVLVSIANRCFYP